MMKGAYFSFGLGDVSRNRSSKTEEWNLCEVVIDKDHRQFITFFLLHKLFSLSSLMGFKKKKKM